MSDVAATPQTTHLPQSRQFPAAFWALLILTAAVRLIGITRPLLGNFATRNVVYAMIARNWVEGNASIWYPTLDVIRDGQRSLIMLEFPVSAYLTAGMWKIFEGSLDIWGRVTSVAFSVGSVALMFLFVRRRHGPTAAAAAGLLLAISPVSIIYGQSFMMEASLVFFTLATFDTLDRWLETGHAGWLATAGACLALLLLTKVYMLVLLLPLAVMVLRPKRTISRATAVRRLGLVVVAGAMLPAACWYAHAMQTASPDGPLAARIFYSVRQSAEAHRPPHPLLWSADFYRQVLDDLTGVVLTPVGFMLLLAGLLDRKWQQHTAWLMAAVVLVAALPRKFNEMNYYYLAVLPPLCIITGLGWQVVQQRMRLGRKAVAGLAGVALVLSLRYAVKPAFVTPDEDRDVPAAGQAVRQLTAEGEPVVTMHGTTIDLLYYCHRPGWALAPDTENLDAVLGDCRRQGAGYLVVVGRRPPTRARPITTGGNFRVYRLSAGWKR